MDTNMIGMEETLIEEVKKRPFIYDKKVTVYKNIKARDLAWKEVAAVLNLRDKEIVKKRWRSLRDSFIKIYRTLKNNPQQVRTKWVYYKQMMFLIPHIELKDTTIKDEDSMNEEDESQDTLHEYNDNENSNEFQCINDESVIFSDVSNGSQNKFENTKKRKRDDLNEEDPLLPSVKHHDPDEQFLLSCLPVLKRLNPRNNAMARLRIQQILFEIEFGTPEEQTVCGTKEEHIDS